MNSRHLQAYLKKLIELEVLHASTLQALSNCKDTLRQLNEVCEPIPPAEPTAPTPTSYHAGCLIACVLIPIGILSMISLAVFINYGNNLLTIIAYMMLPFAWIALFACLGFFVTVF